MLYVRLTWFHFSSNTTFHYFLILRSSYLRQYWVYTSCILNFYKLHVYVSFPSQEPSEGYITNNMEIHLSWENNRRPASQETVRLLLNPKVHCPAQKIMWTLSRARWIQTLWYYFFHICFNIILSYTPMYSLQIFGPYLCIVLTRSQTAINL
jgi:hypothetical protein